MAKYPAIYTNRPHDYPPPPPHRNDRTEPKFTEFILPCLRSNACVGSTNHSDWTLAAFTGSIVDLDVACAEGSTGPLCGACNDDYTFNSLKQLCVQCDKNEKHVAALFVPYAITAGVAAALVGVAYYFRKKIRPLIHRLDTGRLRRLRLAIFSKANLKIVYVTFQIICSTSFTLDVTFPDLFVDYLEFLNILTFDMFGTIR